MEEYDEIFVRTSELYDCAFADMYVQVQYVCDDRIPQSAYEICLLQNVEQCYLDAMQQSIDGTGICTTSEETIADNTDTSITSMCACDR